MFSPPYMKCKVIQKFEYNEKHCIINTQTRFFFCSEQNHDSINLQIEKDLISFYGMVFNYIIGIL